MRKADRILVVDDDPDLGKMVKLMLELKGYAVTLIENAEQVEEILLNNEIDLIIMDMLLSGANGADICEAIKQNPATSCIPIMMMSAYPNGREICLSAGADDFIPKPFEMQDLISKANFFTNKVLQD